MQATLSYPGNSPEGDRPKIDLETLRQRLERYAQQQQVAMAVRCALQGEQLLVVGNHRPNDVQNPRQILQALEHLIKSFQPDFIQQVGLYLRVIGQPQPYLRRQFRLQLRAPEAAEPAPGALAVATPTALVREPTEEGDRAADGWGDLLRLPALSGEAKVLLTGVGAMGLAVGGYGLSQPCVLGQCEALQTARTLGQQSASLIKTADTQKQLATAEQYLDGAIGLLETIPQWSQHAPEANLLEASYEAQQHSLQQVVTAADLAHQALQIAQTPGAGLEHRQAVVTLWQQAIAQLQQVPATSDLYPFARESLIECRSNLEQATQRLQQEQQGRQVLGVAKQLIQLALARQSAQAANPQASNPELMQSMWQVAIDRLQEVPADTTAGYEAKRLLSAYQGRLAAARQAASTAAAPAANPTPGGAPSATMGTVSVPSAAAIAGVASLQDYQTQW